MIDIAEIEEKAAGADLIIIVNPNNPTGTTLPTEQIQGLVTRLPDKLVPVDESFLEFSGQPSLIPWAEAAGIRNLVVLRA